LRHGHQFATATHASPLVWRHRPITGAAAGSQIRVRGAPDAPLLLGVDVGTTNVKAALYDLRGNVQVASSQRLPVDHPRPGWSQYDPDALFDATAAVMRHVLTQRGSAPVAGVAVASMAETAVPLSGAGEALHPAIAWHDERTRPQADWWRRHVGADAVYQRTGLPIVPIFGIHKLMWLREHKPEVYARTRVWLNVADYVAYRLCGVQATDVSLASRLMVLDLTERRWSDDLLSACGVDRSILPEVVQSGQRLGGVHAAGEAATGVPAGTPVAAGGHDHVCGALALGLTEPGDVLDSMGTAESLLTVVERPHLTVAMARGGYQQGAHVVPDRTYCNAGLYTSGACVEWLRSLFIPDEPDPYGVLERWASTSPVGSHGVFFLPHLRLPSPPVVALSARAAFVGLRASTERGDMARALLEGLAFEAHASLEGLVERMDLTLRHVRAIGGGTRNRTLMRIKAALLGHPLEVALHDEATTLGAALLAGVGAGLFRDATDAAARVTFTYDTVEVDDGWRAAYLRAYRSVYQALYPALVDLHHRIDALEDSSHVQ